MDLKIAYPHFKSHRMASVFNDAMQIELPNRVIPDMNKQSGSGDKYKTLPYFGSQSGSGSDIVFDGEHHLKFFGQRHNFTGPGTQVLLRQDLGAPYNTPVNALDACSKSHDLAFTNIGQKLKSGSINRDEMRKLVRDADAEYVDCAKNAPAKDLSEQAEKMIAGQIIKGKMALEKMNVLNPETFIKDNAKKNVVGGSIYKYGNKKIHKNHQKGDGIPMVLLGALASYLVPKIIDTVVGKFKKN